MSRAKKPKMTVWKIFRDGNYLGSNTQKHLALAAAKGLASGGDFMKTIRVSNPMKKTITVTGHHKITIKETRE